MDDAEEALENFARLITAADTVGIWSDAGRNWGVGSKFEDAAAAMGFDIDKVRGLIEKAKKWDEHVRNLQEHGGV